MSRIYDLIIIGSGPAGMTAGIYAARKKLKTLIISKDIGGQTTWSSDIENYPGFTMITGPELVQKFERHLEEFKDDVELRISISGVTKIVKDGSNFIVSMGDKAEKAKAIIIAAGKVPRELGVPGERKFLNKGVSFCAWCDGPLFKGKDIAIIGGGNSAMDAALNVSKLVNQIYIINITSQLNGDQVVIEKIKTLPNIRIINNSEVLKIEGERTVQNISIKTKEGLTKDLPVSGVFVEIGSIPATDYLRDFIELNQENEIVIDKHNMTSVAGVFAAGDITNVLEKQIIIAAGEGAKAAIQAAKYLTKKIE